MISFSLKSPAEIQSISGGFMGSQELMTDRRCIKEGNPREACLMRPVVYNYRAAFTEAPLLRGNLLNGVIVTVSIFIIQVIVALPCAYALAKLRFWGRDVVFGLVIFCLLISSARDCASALHHAREGGPDEHLCVPGHSLDDFGVRHIPHASVLQDRAR